MVLWSLFLISFGTLDRFCNTLPNCQWYLATKLIAESCQCATSSQMYDHWNIMSQLYSLLMMDSQYHHLIVGFEELVLQSPPLTKYSRDGHHICRHLLLWPLLDFRLISLSSVKFLMDESLLLAFLVTYASLNSFVIHLGVCSVDKQGIINWKHLTQTTHTHFPTGYVLGVHVVFVGCFRLRHRRFFIIVCCCLLYNHNWLFWIFVPNFRCVFLFLSFSAFGLSQNDYRVWGFPLENQSLYMSHFLCIECLD